MADYIDSKTVTDAPTVLRTTSLVGRVSILKQITEIATPRSGQPNVIFLTAEGGYGKTRILQTVQQDLQSEQGVKVAHELIDLYHLKNHTIHDFVGSMVDVLSDSGIDFRNYDSARRKLNRMRLSGADVNIGEQRDLMVEEFSDEIQEIAQNEQIVLLLDTAERILYSPFDTQNTTIESAEIWPWLLNHLNLWKNVTLLVAGRPPVRQLATEIKERNDISVTEIDVPAFTQEESLRYFDSVAFTMRSAKLSERADRISAIEEDVRSKAHKESKGLPILLALCIDLYLSTGEIPTANPETIVQHLMQGSEIGETVRALGRLTKGATPELLSKALGCSILDADRRLSDVQNLSFVKIRPEDDRIFLHDEMYAFLREYVYDGERDIVEAKLVYQAVLDVYQSAIEQNQAELDKLFRPIEFEGKEHVEISRLVEISMERRTLMTESLYYRLYENPVEGFKYYYRFMREAIYSGDTLLDRELLLTLVEFWGEHDPENKKDDIDGLEKRVLNGIGYVRPVTRAFAEHRYIDAIELASLQRQQIKSDMSGAFHTTLAVLNIWDAFAKILLGETVNNEDAHSLLNESIEHMRAYLGELKAGLPDNMLGTISRLNSNSIDPKIDLRHWRAKAVLALGYRVRGYMHWANGNNLKAIEDNRMSALLWTEVGILVELGWTKNDLGFALHEQLKWDDARDLATEALSIRRRLGSRATVALSINTLALIDLAEGRYTDGRERATVALSLFRAIDSQRGKGLALIALCEALRRLAVTDTIPNSEDKIRMLREARDLGLEAIDIFTAKQEIIRLIEAYMEVGCTCREWIEVIQTNPNRRDNPERLFEEGQIYLNNAIELAAKANAPLRSIDALIDLARLAYYVNDQTVETQSIELALNFIPKEYLIGKSTGEPTIQKSESNPAYWPLLGKIFYLRGQQAFSDYEKSASKWQRDPKHPSLREMAEYYMLCHQYFSFRDDDYRDLRRGTTSIHANLSELGATESQAFALYVVEAEQKYNIEESQVRKMLVRRGMWALATS